MADDGYKTIRLREDFLADIEQFLKTSAAKKNNVNSIADFVYRASAPILAEIMKEYGIFNRRRLRGKYTFEAAAGED